MELTERYEILGLLGHGGFGRVFHVRDRWTRQEGAAKLPRNPADPAQLRAFVREAEQLVRYGQMGLRHVIRAVDGDLGATNPYFVMEYAEGGSIAKWAGKLDERQVMTAMRQLMETLAVIHDRGGFHRDVKPDNLLLLSDGTVAVADFGLGNSPDCTLHFTRGAGGTEGYAAPELYRAHSFCAACDVFSAGATWFHLLTGCHPKGRGLPLDPRAVDRRIAPAVASWIRAMTDPDPDGRPPAIDVHNALFLALDASVDS